MQKKIAQKKVLFIAHCSLTTILLTAVTIFWINHPTFVPKIFRENSSENRFTNPILDCENGEPGKDSVIATSSLKNKVEELQKKYKVPFVALYFRDLNNGQWNGVNEKEYFSPASLLKAPLLIAFFKYAEENNAILKKRVTVQQSDVASMLKQNIVSSSALEVGKSYSLLEIAQIMIRESNNTAGAILMQYVPEKYVADVFAYVGVPYKNELEEQDIQVKDYAGFFRIMYNASYLTRDFSEKALKILSETQYVNGLVAGIPSDIVVAHKFGERIIQTRYYNGTVVVESTQLHDCGIVYYPQKPYLLCMMTRANNIAAEEKVLQQLSAFVYSEVAKNK